MNTNTMFIGAVLCIVGIGIGYVLWGTNAQTSIGNLMMPNGSMPAGQRLGVGGMSQNIDQHFIAQMIPHHEGAIEMAKIALERSKRSEIISLAHDIIEAQQKEIDDMRGWYQEWFDTTPPDGGFGMMGNMRMGGMEGDTTVLARVSDAEFDREFIEQMIPHHEMAIMMAGMLQASTERAEMKQLADNIITSQSREIEMMQGWLRVWYTY